MRMPSRQYSTPHPETQKASASAVADPEAFQVEAGDDLFFRTASEQVEKLLYSQTSAADQSAEGAFRKLFVLRDGEICPDSGFDHYEMAADLPNRLPASLAKRLGRLTAGDVG